MPKPTHKSSHPRKPRADPRRLRWGHTAPAVTSAWPKADLKARSSLQPAKGGQAEDGGTRSAKPRAGDGVPAPAGGPGGSDRGMGGAAEWKRLRGVTEERGRPRSGKDLGATPADAACGSCSLLVPVKRPSSGDTYETAGKTASRDGCFLTPGVRAAF